MKRAMWILALVAGGLSIFSCKKGDSQYGNNNAQMSMRLTDDPSAYDAVYVDIRQIGVTMDGQAEVLLTPNRAGVYNLLDFRNGLDTLLISTSIHAGNISQVRLVLGDNNGVVVHGVYHHLSTPSAQESGLKLNLKTTLAANTSYVIWVDFDAGKSIVTTGNGSYKLKPVIRAYSELTNGRISGYVMPLAAFSTVYAINGADTTVAIPNSTDGHFVISGLAEGDYQLMVVPAVTGYLAFSTTVHVLYGKTVDEGTITVGP